MVASQPPNESFHPVDAQIPSHTFPSSGTTKMPPIPTSRKWAQIQPQRVTLGHNEKSHWKCLVCHSGPDTCLSILGGVWNCVWLVPANPREGHTCVILKGLWFMAATRYARNSKKTYF